MLFWSITPRVMHAIVKGARRREVNAHNANVWLAYNTVALGRIPKRLPPLRSLLIERDGPAPKARHWRQQLAVARQMYGKA